MTLYELVRAAQYMQVFSIYLTNAYGQNIPVARGTLAEMQGSDLENDDELFLNLMHQVEYYHITDKGVMVVFIRDDHFEENASYNYSEDYVKRWDRKDPKTRPWLFCVETEEYTEKYLWKFPGYGEEVEE